MQPFLIDATLESTRPLLYGFATTAEIEGLLRVGAEPALWLPPLAPNDSPGDQRTPEERRRVAALRLTALAKAARTGGVVLPDTKSERRVVLRERAGKRLLCDERGRTIIPVNVMFACFRDAGCQVALPSRSISYSFSGDTILPSLFQFLRPHYVLEHDDWEPDYRFIRTHADRNKPRTADFRVVVHPRIERWKMRLQIVVTPQLGFTVDHAVKIFKIAGDKVGLGIMRGPRKDKVSFGAFKVTAWDVAEFDGRQFERPSFERVVTYLPPETQLTAK